MSKAKRLKAAMKAKGWKDTDLAEASGVHITLVRRYLKGEVDVGVKNAPAIARALDISNDEVLYGSSAA